MKDKTTCGDDNSSYDISPSESASHSQETLQGVWTINKSDI